MRQELPHPRIGGSLRADRRLDGKKVSIEGTGIGAKALMVRNTKGGRSGIRAYPSMREGRSHDSSVRQHARSARDSLTLTAHRYCYHEYEYPFPRDTETGTRD